MAIAALADAWFAPSSSLARFRHGFDLHERRVLSGASRSCSRAGVGSCWQRPCWATAEANPRLLKGGRAASTRASTPTTRPELHRLGRLFSFPASPW